MKKWARNLRRTGEVKNDKPNLVIVAANNHYAGFGPGTANMFRKMLGLEEVVMEG
jgi:3-oxoacyl-[acyl-carrier-protein] synthase III